MSYNNPRIDLTDSVMSMFTKMADGNPGALTVLMRTFKEGAAIDPDSALAEISTILSLDTHDIYGHEIWGFYKDVCGQDLVMMLGLLRAVQLGMAPESEIKQAIAERGSMLDARKNELLELVKARLPKFGRQETQGLAVA